MLLPFLLNWYLNPYHTPIVAAKRLGLFEEFDIDLALIEPTHPSDVTKIIGEGYIPIGLKAMVHCFAARARGFPIRSIATLLDEPPTGIIAPKQLNFHAIDDIKNKKIGYVGEFGKVMLDHLVTQAGLPLDCYEAVKVGMDGAQAIRAGQVDATIGIGSFQQIELEEAGIRCDLLRIDRLANLGCCCFCSIQVIAHEKFITQYNTVLADFVFALQQGSAFTRENPKESWQFLIAEKPSLNTPVYEKIFYSNLPFFSKDCRNVVRDWEKVAKYAKTLNITDNAIGSTDCYTNQFFSPESITP